MEKIENFFYLSAGSDSASFSLFDPETLINAIDFSKIEEFDHALEVIEKNTLYVSTGADGDYDILCFTSDTIPNDILQLCEAKNHSIIHNINTPSFLTVKSGLVCASGSEYITRLIYELKNNKNKKITDLIKDKKFKHHFSTHTINNSSYECSFYELKDLHQESFDHRRIFEKQDKLFSIKRQLKQILNWLNIAVIYYTLHYSIPFFVNFINHESAIIFLSLFTSVFTVFIYNKTINILLQFDPDQYLKKEKSYLRKISKPLRLKKRAPIPSIILHLKKIHP